MARKPVAEVVASASHADLTSGSPDEGLLAAWRGGVEGLRARVRRAYDAARDRTSAAPDREDWVHVDAAWKSMQKASVAALRAQGTVNFNSAPHQAACVEEVRALLVGVEWFSAYQPPKAPKNAATNALIFAHHAASGGEHFLETRDRLEREQAMRDLTGAAA